MCGRFSQVMEKDDLIDALDAEMEFSSQLVPRYNVAPSQDIVCMIRHHEKIRVGTMLWGLTPDWSKKRLINAKWEKFSSGKGYWAAWKRCVIPASGFYEWERKDGKKIPHKISRIDEKPLMMAAIWSWAKINSDRKAVTVVLTSAAKPWISKVHHRQPILLKTEEIETWFTGKNPKEINYQNMMLRKVSDHVNNVRNEGPLCWEPENHLGT